MKSESLKAWLRIRINSCHGLPYAKGMQVAFSEVLAHIEDVESNPRLYCEHGILDGEYCEPCNLEYKRAAKAAGLE